MAVGISTLNLDWQNALKLRSLDPSKLAEVLDELENRPGIYIFGRRFGSKFSPRYIGKAGRIRTRIKQQIDNHRLMHFVFQGPLGGRELLVGYLDKSRWPHLNVPWALKHVEAAFIQHFIAEGYDLHNTMGTKLKKVRICSRGAGGTRAIPGKLDYKL